MQRYILEQRGSLHGPFDSPQAAVRYQRKWGSPGGEWSVRPLIEPIGTKAGVAS